MGDGGEKEKQIRWLLCSLKSKVGNEERNETSFEEQSRRSLELKRVTVLLVEFPGIISKDEEGKGKRGRERRCRDDCWWCQEG